MIEFLDIILSHHFISSEVWAITALSLLDYHDDRPTVDVAVTWHFSPLKPYNKSRKYSPFLNFMELNTGIQSLVIYPELGSK